MTMSFLIRTAAPHSAAAAPAFPDLSVVALTHDVDVEGSKLPKGSKGTVVYVYEAGAAYEVEFERPFHAVVTLDADAVTA